MATKKEFQLGDTIYVVINKRLNVILACFSDKDDAENTKTIGMSKNIVIEEFILY